MATERVERRLAAILAADVAGYSRLIGVDEEGTLARLRTIRRDLADPKIAEHKGRVVKTTGDGVLVEFASVVDALRCAVELQQAMAERTASVPPANRIEFRIGIHQGDIVVEDGDIFGDGVNIAARLEGIAEPGGICVSARIQEDAAGRLDVAFEDLGEPELKNIARPVRVYRVAAKSPHPNPPPQAEEGPLSPPSLAGEGGARAQRGRVGAAGSPDLPLPDKPSVAVLPFANMSSDPEQEFLADGIAEDVITALSRYPSLFVIARNSCFTYKSRAVEVRQVGRELGVRYVLEGSLRKSANRIRVTAQLVEAETGNHLWAERYDRDVGDIFAVQDEITEAVTIAIAPTIAQAERQRAMRKPPESLDAWAAYQRGLWHLAKANADDNARAESFFRLAIGLDPNFAGGHYGLASAQHQGARLFHTRDLAEAQSSAEALARQAIALDPTDAQAHAFLAITLMLGGDHEAARGEAEQALAINPNLARAHGSLGATLIFSGRPQEGLAALRTCIRLDPRDPELVIRLLQVAQAHYFSQEYEAAIEAATRAVRTFPDYPTAYRWLAPALGQLGRTEEAKAALAKAMAPLAFDLHVRKRVPWMRPEDHAHMLDGLRKAGWEG